MSQMNGPQTPHTPEPPAGYGPQSGFAYSQQGGGYASPNGGGYEWSDGAGYYAQPNPPRKKGRAWIVALVSVIAVCAALIFGMWSCSNAFMGTSGSGTDADLLTSDAVAIINIDGTIQYDGTACSPEGLKQQLDTAANNTHIKAVVLRVNSGGGIAAAGEEMTTYLREFKETSHKPVVVSSAATNASAAYEISSQADYIYVVKSTAIGAIGTAIQFMDYSGLMEMLGITTEDITSSSSKDSTYGTRSLTDEERAYYQDQINQINEIFIDNVAQGRDMSTDEVRVLATGMTFTGSDAIENGLADEVGTQEDAIEKAAELAGCWSYTTVSLEGSSMSDLDMLLDLMSESKGTISADDLASALKELDGDGSIKQ